MGRPNEHERIARLFATLHLLERDRFYSFETIGKLMGRNAREARQVVDSLATIDMEEYRPPFFMVDDEERAVLEAGGETDSEADAEHATGIWMWDTFAPFDKPFDFMTDEAQALVASLDYMGASADEPLRRKIMGRVLAENDDMPRTRLLIDAATHERFMSRLSYLVESSRLARIVYRPLGADESHVHLVEPQRVYADTLEEWCLDAFPCPGEPHEGELRTYRIDRIVEMDEPGGHFERRSLPAGETFFESLEHAPRAQLTMDANEPIEPREWPCCRIHEAVDGTKAVEVPYFEHGWIARQVIGKAGRVQVNTPEEMRDEVASTAEEMLRDARAVRARLEKR